MVAVGDLVRLYLDGGFFMHLILLWSLLAFGLQLAQLLLARKLALTGVFTGSAAVLLSLGVVGTSIGYRLGIDVIAARGVQPGLVFKLMQVALIPLLFALGVVAALAVVQVATELLGRTGVESPRPPMRLPRALGALAALAVALSAAGLVRTTMLLSDAMTRPPDDFTALVARTILDSTGIPWVAGLLGIGFGAGAVATAIYAAIQGAAAAGVVAARKSMP